MFKTQGFAGLFVKESTDPKPVTTRNEGRGYSGEWSAKAGGPAGAAKKFEAMFKTVAKATGEKDAKKIGNYLDSVHGRHLAGAEMDNKDMATYIKKDFANFSRTYKASQYEEDWE